MSTNRQIENLRVAYSVMAGFPAHKVELNSVRRNHKRQGIYYASDRELLGDCGTTGCIAGVLSAHPYFKNQGFYYTDRGTVLMNRVSMDLDRMSNKLFGHVGLFNSGPSGLAGKVTALTRIRRVLRVAGAITPERDLELQQQEKRIVD